MADFARWVTAAEPALGLQKGAFLKAYARNIESAADLALEFSPVVMAICDLVEEESALALVSEPGRDTTRTAWTWVGALPEYSCSNWRDRDPGIKQQRGWPRSAAALSNVLRRLAPVLQRRGISLEFDRREGHERRRLISLKKAGGKPRPRRPRGYAIRSGDPGGF